MSHGNVNRFWRIVTFTPLCPVGHIYFYRGHNLATLHQFADDCVYDTINDYFRPDEEWTFDEFYQNSGYDTEEISYETFREYCGY